MSYFVSGSFIHWDFEIPYFSIVLAIICLNGEIQTLIPNLNRNFTHEPRVWIWRSYRQGLEEYFWVLNFKDLYAFLVLVLLYFMMLSNKCCIFKCFIFPSLYYWL